MKNVSVSKENVRANVVFFGDYDVVRISDDNDRYAELVSKLVKKKFIPSSAQEFSMQVNMNPNGVRIKEDIPERKVIFRPVFLSNASSYKRIISIKADRLDIVDESCSDLKAFISDASDYVKAFESSFQIKHSRMAINVRFKLYNEKVLSEDSIRKRFCPNFLTMYEQEGNSLTAWYTQFARTKEINLEEQSKIKLNLVISVEESAVSGKDLREFWGYIDVNTDAENKDLLLNSDDLSLLMPIVLEEKVHILEAVDDVASK